MERLVKEAKGGDGEMLCAEQGFAMDGCLPIVDGGLLQDADDGVGHVMTRVWWQNNKHV